MLVVPCPCMNRFMPPHDQWDSNPVFQNAFFNSYVDLFVSYQDLIGYPQELIEESTMTEQEYNDIIAIPSAFDVHPDDIVVSEVMEYYTDEEMVYMSDAEDNQTGSEGGNMMDITILDEDDEIIRGFIAAYDVMIASMGGVPGSGTRDDPYDLT